MKKGYTSCILMKKFPYEKFYYNYFFDFLGVVHYEYLQPGQTVNKQIYLSLLMSLGDAAILFYSKFSGNQKKIKMLIF